MGDMEIIETKISHIQFSTWKHAEAGLHERWLASCARIARIGDDLWRNIIELELHVRRYMHR